MKQLAFEFGSQDAVDVPFIVSDGNAPAFALVDSWPDWPSPWAALYGAQGIGKTHLARLWWQNSDAVWVTQDDLADAPVRNTVLDLKDASALRPDLEEVLFHRLNNLRLSGCFLLITSRASPALWPVSLPDLQSRLRSVLAVELLDGDDAFFEQLLTSLLAVNQVTLSERDRRAALKRLPKRQSAFSTYVASLT